MSQLISIEGIECYSYHGCQEEEAMIGGKYSVDIYVWKNVSSSFSSDELNDTVDYGMVHEVVRKEMAVRSKLIEHAANRILEKLSEKIKAFEKISVRVTKYNPPVNGNIKKESFLLSKP